MTRDLNLTRQVIDQIDSQIVALLEQRLDCVQDVIAYKKANNLPILDSNRENLVIEKVRTFVQNQSYQDTITNTFKDIMAHSRAYQKQHLL